MTNMKESIIIPSWISYRTYLFATEQSRTYILNEKSHTYIQLDGLSSDLWKLICEDDSEEELDAFIRKNGLEDQIDEFLVSLQDLKLIITKENESLIKASYEPFGAESSPDEETRFVEEMKVWLYENKFMFSIFFELTYRCDLKCVHCYNPKHMSNIEIDFELLKKAIDDAYELGCFRVTFSGGEATLHTKFSEIVKYARSKHMSVEIFTNGQTLSRNKAIYDSVLSLYPHRICVSLYSTDENMHERVTAVSGSFENTYSLIRQMRKDNINVQIKNFLLDFNCMDCIGVKKMAEGLGATSVADISLIPTIEGSRSTLKYALDEDKLFALYTNPESPLYIGENYKPLDLEKIADGTPCFGGITGLTITPEAEAVVCVSMPYSFGNLKVTSLKEIWRSAMEKKPDSKLYQWQSVRISDCEECYKEDYCAFCNYCPGMGYLENGYLKRSDVQCAQAKTKMKAYKYLKSLGNS